MATTRPGNDLLRQRDIRDRPKLTAPPHLSTAAKKVWNRTQQENPHLRQQYYAEALTAFCMACARRDEAQHLLDTEGLTVTSERGNVQPHPAAGIVASATSQVARLSTQLGLVPSSRREHVRMEEEPLPDTGDKTPLAARLWLA